MGRPHFLKISAFLLAFFLAWPLAAPPLAGAQSALPPFFNFPCNEQFAGFTPGAHAAIPDPDPMAFYASHREFASPHLQAEITRTGADRDPARMQGVVDLIKRVNEFHFTPLATGVEKAGLPDDILNKLRAHSREFLSLPELLARQDFKGGYALGLTNVSKVKIPTAISAELGMEDWLPAYTRHGIDWRSQTNHTDLFMKAITAEEKPIVMFIPPNFLDHSKAGITRDEFNWLLAHPEKMKHVSFVFGAYDLISMPNASTQVELLKRRTVTGFFEDYLGPALRAYRKRLGIPAQPQI